MRIVFFLLLALSLTACKKGAGEFTLEGKITDETFNSGLNGATLELYKTPIGTTTEILIETLTLTSDGLYSIKFPRERMEKYRVKVIKENYFTIDQNIFYSSLEIGKTNVRNYSTKAKAWVELRLINNSPNSSDHLRYIKQAGLQGCEECCPSSEQNFYGALNTSIYCINNGNTTYSIYYWVIGTNNQGLKEVVTTPFDTTQILISY